MSSPDLTASEMTATLSPAARNVLRWINEGLNRIADPAGLAQFVSPSLRLHLPVLRPTATGIDGALAYFDMFHRTWGGSHTDAELLVDSGNKVAVLVRTRARHQGAYMRSPASNLPVGFSQTFAFHADATGTLVEAWILGDEMGLAMQVGAVPPEAARKPASALAWAVSTGLRRPALRRRALAVEPPSGNAAAVGEALGPVESSEGLRLAQATVCRMFHERMNVGDLRGATEDLGGEPALHLAPSIEPHPVVGREAWIAFISTLFDGFPDLTFTVEDLFGNADLVFARVRLSGTHRGEYRGMPPTGRPFTIYEALIFRVGDTGLLLEGWQEVDALALLLQVGMFPAHGLSPLGIVRWFGRAGFSMATTAISKTKSSEK